MQNVINFQSFLMDHSLAFALLIAWSIACKGFALWKAGKNNSPIWFIILLLVNTLGILEIIYLFAIKNKPEENKSNSSPVNTEVKTETKVETVTEEKKEEITTPAVEVKSEAVKTEEVQQTINQ